MIASLVWLLVIVAIIAVVYWAINQLSLPKPAKVVALALLMIIALVFIARLLMGII